MTRQHAMKTNGQISGEEFGIQICGRVKAPLDLGIDTLLAMDTVDADDLLLICGSGEPRGKIYNCRGVLLSDIINKAEVVVTDHNDTKKMYIVASSGDGYKAVFSWQEIFNSPVGEGVMVLLEKDGKRLFDEYGSVDLLSARDNLTGPRYVRQLGTIEIVMVG